MQRAGEFVSPDLSRPIIGYREWVLVGDEILSPLARTLWGRIELHQRGMRAEFARIVALALPSSGRHADLVAQVAELLDVEAVRARELPVAALAYGEPLEPTLIPT